MGLVTRRRFLGATAAGLLLAGLDLGVPAATIAIEPRSSWATNRPPKGPLPTEEVRFLIVHHSASHNGHTSAEVPAILRSFYDFHTGERGWNDIAYNFLVDSEGGVWEGRAGSLDGPVAGDATGGNQGFSQLVCVIGDYDRVRPTSASVRSLVAVLAWLGGRYGVDTTPGAEVTFTSRGSNRWPAGTVVTTPTITGHRAMSRTTCPGNNLDRYLVGELMADVTAARRGATEILHPGTAALTSTTMPTATSTAPATSAETATTVPTARPGDPSLLAQDQPASSPADEVPPVVTTTTTLPAATPPPLRSPLVVGAGVLAAAATTLAVWRGRRMSRQ